MNTRPPNGEGQKPAFAGQTRAPEQKLGVAFDVRPTDVDETPRQVAMLGLDDIFDRGAIMLIEWGEGYRDVLPSRETIDIRIETAGDERTISITRTLPSPDTTR